MKRSSCLFLVFAFVLSLSAMLWAEPISYARYPALSPDNQTIAFTWRGRERRM